MPTPQGIAAANAQSTGEAWLVLAEINHASFAAPIRIARNKQNVPHQGQTYIRHAFDVGLPDETSERLAVGRIEMDDVGEFEVPETGETRTIGDFVKAIPVGENVTVTITIVLASDPELIEMGPMEFTLRNVKGNGLTLSGDLHFEDLMNEPYPCDSLPV
ncbi:DUF1833 family protein [Shumkonia mesophila]|uniref:DUF1833 family protein n=1 Tax=Shumkonia mesophila TaxID=2838854 RepID=UPI00293492C0|nr:DUF1833 family protein [Shumkonia mesophila]